MNIVFNYGLISLYGFLQDIIWNLNDVGKRGEEKLICIPSFLDIPKFDHSSSPEPGKVSNFGKEKSPEKIKE